MSGRVAEVNLTPPERPPVLGASSESYRKEIARRTRRGLEGLARNHKPTGGRSYGYIAAAESESGDRETNQVAAKVVLCIFEMRANGHSARSIAAALNRGGVPSPSLRLVPIED